MRMRSLVLVAVLSLTTMGIGSPASAATAVTDNLLYASLEEAGPIAASVEVYEVGGVLQLELTVCNRLRAVADTGVIGVWEARCESETITDQVELEQPGPDAPGRLAASTSRGDLELTFTGSPVPTWPV